MSILKTLVIITAIGFFSGCGDSVSEDRVNAAFLEYNNMDIGYDDLNVVEVSSPWKLENLHSYSARSKNRPILVYYSSFGSLEARKFEHYVLSVGEVFKMLDREFTIFEIMMDDKGDYTTIHGVGDTTRRPKSEWWMDYQTERYNRYEIPLFDIWDFETASLVDQPATYTSHLNPEIFLNWLKEGLANFKRMNP